MQRYLMLTIVFLLAADSPETAKQEKERMQGTWRVEQARRGGKKEPALDKATVTIDGDDFISRAGDTVLTRGTLTIDGTKNPKTIDLLYTEGDQKGKQMRGIYNLKGATWALLFSDIGEERPTSLEKEAEKGYLSLILKAVKTESK